MNDLTAAADDIDLPALRNLFLTFARLECGSEPLYDALCRIAADEPSLLRLLAVAAPPQRRPNLLLAAIHDLMLAGSTHALAAYYPSVGGTRGADAALRETLLAFCVAERDALIERIAQRTTQTNEIGRCAVLWPVLRDVAVRSGRGDIALLDFGCSAGLNLGVDRYRYDYGEFALGAIEAVDTPRIECRLVGAKRPSAAAAPRIEIAQRLGIDPAPIGVDDEREVRWLRACIWPHDAVRHARFELAVALAREQRWPVRTAADCSAAVEEWVQQLPSEVLPVVFNSWVLTYLSADALATHLQRMASLVQERGMVWISAEGPWLRIGGARAPAVATDASAEHRAGSWWTVAMAGGDSPRYEVIARSHPHGRWLEWLA